MAAGNDKTSAATDAIPPAEAAANHPAEATGAAAGAAASKRARPRDGRQREGNVGQALRSVYQQTVNEDIPDEMLDLLGKLT